MAESVLLKRSRDQETITSDHDQQDMKRQRLIALLDEEFCVEEEPNQDDASSFITALQKEIYSSNDSDDANSSSSSDPLLLISDIALEGYKIDDCVEQELRRLFEASDEDLGIVSSSSSHDDEESYADSEEEALLCGFDVGLWEFEDHESAKY